MDEDLGEPAHQAGGREIGRYEVERVPAGGAGEGFGGEVAAADGALHGGGPTGGGPVSGEEDARPGGDLWGAEGVDAGAGGIGGVDFFNHGRFHEVGGAGCGKEFANFIQGEVDDFGARFIDEALGGADDEFDVAAA